eukprot:13025266-Heterocapsa_arctica.AAC.1
MIFPGPDKLFRSLFDQLVAFFGVPTKDRIGITPGSLRPGGATHLYKHADVPEKVRYRGRWKSRTVFEIYIQEVAA